MLGTSEMTMMLSSPDYRKTFIFSCIHTCRRWGFDGIQLAFSYPGGNGSPISDKFRYTELLQEMLQQFEEESKMSKKERLLITAAVPSSPHFIDNGYQIERISLILDQIHLMSYDFHGAWDSVTGLNAPLNCRIAQSHSESESTVEWAALYWLSRGVPKPKLIVGIPFYGRSFQLLRPDTNGLKAPTKSGGSPGPYTQSSGFLSSYEICSKMKNNTVNSIKTVHVDTKYSVPFLYYGDQWISYEDTESIEKKARWVKQYQLGGCMVWSLDLDDFKGVFCSHDDGNGITVNESYPFLKTIKRVLTDEIGNHKVAGQFLDAGFDSANVEIGTDDDDDDSEARLLDKFQHARDFMSAGNVNLSFFTSFMMTWCLVVQFLS